VKFRENPFSGSRVFLQYKGIIRIVTVSSYLTPCKRVIQGSELLTLSPQCILSLMRFLPQNLVLYTLNSAIRGFNTRHKLQLRSPSSTFSAYQKGAYYDSIKIFEIYQIILLSRFWGKSVLYQMWRSI